MNLLTKLAHAGTSLVVVASSLAFSLAPALAAGTGQVDTGNQNYKIANNTKGTAFANPQSADACDVLEYRLKLYNPGPDNLGTVKVEASINAVDKTTSYTSTATAYTPDGVVGQSSFQAKLTFSSAVTQKYNAGSTKLLDSAGSVLKTSAAGGGLADTITMGAGGIDIGSINESVTRYVQFTTTLSCPPVIVDKCPNLPGNQTEIPAGYIIDASGNCVPVPPVDKCPNLPGNQTEIPAGYIIDASGNCVPVPPAPSYTCDNFTVAASDDRTIKVTGFHATAVKDVKYKNSVVDWGDATDKYTSTNPTGKTHQYAQDGTYTITATAHFTLKADGSDLPGVSGPACTTSVKFETGKPPVVTPPTVTATTVAAAPKTLVNTGAGSTIGMFVAATLVGTAAYRRRLLSRQ